MSEPGVQSTDGKPLEPTDPRFRVAIVASILGPVIWLSLTLLYVGFWASGFTLFQSVVLVLVSLLVLAGVLGTVWYLWAARHPQWFPPSRARPGSQ